MLKYQQKSIQYTALIPKSEASFTELTLIGTQNSWLKSIPNMFRDFLKRVLMHFFLTELGNFR